MRAAAMLWPRRILILLLVVVAAAVMYFQARQAPGKHTLTRAGKRWATTASPRRGASSKSPSRLLARSASAIRAWPRSLIALGYLAVAQAQDDDAERRFHQALDLLEKHGAGETLDAADALSGLATAAGHRLQDGEAETFLRRALAIRKKLLGQDDPEVAGTVSDLAWVRCNEGQYLEAEALSRQALAMREKTLAADHIAVVRNHCDLAFFLLRQCKYAEAEPMLGWALAILDRGDDSLALDLARGLNGRAGLESSLGHFEKAEVLLILRCESTRRSWDPSIPSWRRSSPTWRASAANRGGTTRPGRSTTARSPCSNGRSGRTVRDWPGR